MTKKLQQIQTLAYVTGRCAISATVHETLLSLGVLADGMPGASCAADFLLEEQLRRLGRRGGGAVNRARPTSKYVG